MKARPLLPALLLFAATPVLRADDIEIVKREPGPAATDFGDLTITLTPSPAQKEEIETQHTMTLSDAQWQKIREYYPGQPRRIGRVANTLGSLNTGSRGFEGLTDASGRVILSADNYHDTVPAPCELYATALFKVSSLVLSLDHRGQFYFQGTLIPYEQLAAATENSRPCDPDASKTFEILLPPGMTGTEAALHERLQKIRSLLTAKGWVGPTKVQENSEE